MTEVPDFDTLEDAKAWLRENIQKGARCPCCTQFAKVYRRLLSAVSARALIALYRTAGMDFAHMPTVVKRRTQDTAHQGGAATLCGYWDLMLEENAERPDGGRTGWWRVTLQGREFIEGRLFVPKYAHTYAGRVLRLSGPRIGIRQALHTRFDYDELMAR